MTVLHIRFNATVYGNFLLMGTIHSCCNAAVFSSILLLFRLTIQGKDFLNPKMKKSFGRTLTGNLCDEGTVNKHPLPWRSKGRMYTIHHAVFYYAAHAQSKSFNMLVYYVYTVTLVL